MYVFYPMFFNVGRYIKRFVDSDILNNQMQSYAKENASCMVFYIITALSSEYSEMMNPKFGFIPDRGGGIVALNLIIL